MAFWGIEVKPGQPFSLKFDDGVRKRLHISQATLAIGASKQTSLVQCNVGDKSPVLLCALLPDKSESLQLNLEFDEDEEVLFSVIGPRGVHLTGFYTGVDPSFNDDVSESYGEDIENSENEESVRPSDEDEYEDSFIDNDENLEVLPTSHVSADAAFDDDTDKQGSKTKTNKPRVDGPVKNDDLERTMPKKKINGATSEGKTLEADPADHSNAGDGMKKNEEKTNGISFGQDPTVTNEIANDPGMNMTMPKKKIKCTASEGKTLEADPADHSNEGDVLKKSEEKTNDIAFGQDPTVINEIANDPGMNMAMPKKKIKGAASEGNTREADPADHSNEGDVLKRSEEKTNEIAFGQDPTVTNEIANDPGMNMTVPKKKGTSYEDINTETDAADHSNLDDKAKKSESKTSDIAVYQDPIDGNKIHVDPGITKTMPKKKGKGVSKKDKILKADAADHSNPDHKAKKSEAKTNDIAIGQDPIVTSEIDVDPRPNKRSNLLPSHESGLESGTKPKRKRKERPKEEKIPEANTDDHLKSFQEKKYLQADIGADDMDQDLHMGKENDRRPFNKTETGLSAGSVLPIVEEGSEKLKKKRRIREQEQKTPAVSDLVVPERKADDNTSEKVAKKKKPKREVQKNDENMDIPVSFNREKENSINNVQKENVMLGSSQVRTLSNGLIIEDLESSKSNGKAAGPGKKLKVKYTAKLKENGEIIDSNGKAPYRFLLGDEGVMQGWNIGLDGMRAGDKRRLVVPPSLGNGSKGTAKKVQPDSWVIYDVEVLSVH